MYLLAGNDDLAAKWIEVVEQHMAEFQKDSAHREKYFIALFYKGVLLKHKKQYAEAIECFKSIIAE